MTITPTLITPPTAPTFSAWQVDFDNPSDAMTAMIAAAQLGYQAGASCFPGDPTAPVWQFEFSQPGREPQKAREHDWIVSDGETITCYTPSQFAATFTADVPLVWSSTLTARPTAGGTAEVIVAAPTSPTGPWTWAMSGGGTVESTTVTGSDVVLHVGGLTAGQEYTFTVTVTDHYDHTATSGPSNTVTAVD